MLFKKNNLSNFKKSLEKDIRNKFVKKEVKKDLIKFPWKNLIISNLLIILILFLIAYLPPIEQLNNYFRTKLNYFIAVLILLIVIIALRNLKKQKYTLTKDEFLKQRTRIKELLNKTEHKKRVTKDWVKTDVKGFDLLFDKGIPQGAAVLVAGGAGSGKTNFCLQILYNAIMRKEKCLYISLEESEEKLKKHMLGFNWNTYKPEQKGLLMIKRYDPFEISKSVEALLAKAKGELKMDINELGKLIPEDFEPEWVFIDSMTALASAFRDEEDNYRIYIEQLFLYLESLNINSFLISETDQMPTRFSRSGVEEFLADGVIVLYHIRRENIRERAIEVLKMRGTSHKEKLVPMEIIAGKGVEVYPEQEIFGGLEFNE